IDLNQSGTQSFPKLTARLLIPLSRLGQGRIPHRHVMSRAQSCLLLHRECGQASSSEVTPGRRLTKPACRQQKSEQSRRQNQSFHTENLTPRASPKLRARLNLLSSITSANRRITLCYPI